MDRGERRRRDEVYVKWIKRKTRDTRWGCDKAYINNEDYWAFRIWYKDWKKTKPWYGWLTDQNLGAKKKRPMSCGCSKKTRGKPKVGRGMCKNRGWTPRRKWRLQLDEE